MWSEYLGDRAHAPAIQLVQAPVFYGYAFAAYAEFAVAAGARATPGRFQQSRCKVAAPGDPAPKNVTVAGESEIHLARIEPDPSVPAGVWIWRRR